jgi:hypothetical protein
VRPWRIRKVPETLCGLLRTLTLSARDQASRDPISSRLMGYRDQNGQDWADIIDFLTMHPEARRQLVRLLAELGASDE